MKKHLFYLWVTGSLIGAVCSEKKCLKEESLGQVVGNSYYCPNHKPQCCQRNSQFTCCEANEIKTLREQAQLWGTVAAVCILIGLVFVCCKQDYTFCSGDERTFSQRFGLRKKPEPKLTDLNQPRSKDNAKRGNSRSAGGSLPPLPSTTGSRESHQHGGYNGKHTSLYYENQQGNYNPGYIEDERDYYRY